MTASNNTKSYNINTTTPLKNNLYLLTNEEPLASLLLKLELLCPHISLLQYRRKKTPAHKQADEIAHIKKLCDKYGVGLIINDNIALAKQFHAGVHLGQGDGSIIEARKQLVKDAIIGRTCHQSINLALEAEAEGASYVAFGAYKASKTKPEAQLVCAHTIQEAVSSINVPICVIGGITLADVLPLQSLGVSYIAMVQGLLAGTVVDVKNKVDAMAGYS